MRKCKAEFYYGGRWITLQSTFRPFLSAALHKMYNDQDLFDMLYRVVGNKEMRVIVDVGGAIGYYAIMYALAFPSATVYTIEPSSVNYDDMYRNVFPFDNIVPMKGACLDRDGAVDIALPLARTKAYCHSPDNTGQVSIYGDSMLHREVVPTQRLDDMFSSVDYIKTDTEGADLLVLRGAERLLKTSRPIVQIEMLTSNFVMSKTDPSELLNFMASLEYKPVSEWGIDFIYYPMEILPDEIRKTEVKVVAGAHRLSLRTA